MTFRSEYICPRCGVMILGAPYYEKQRAMAEGHRNKKGVMPL